MKYRLINKSKDLSVSGLAHAIADIELQLGIVKRKREPRSIAWDTNEDMHIVVQDMIHINIRDNIWCSTSFDIPTSWQVVLCHQIAQKHGVLLRRARK